MAQFASVRVAQYHRPTHIDALCIERLPNLLQNGCSAFVSRRERDVFLLTATVVLSGCMQEVTGLYDGRNVHANLFCFVIAPPASGKGVMLWARRLGSALEAHKLKQSEAKRQAHQIREKEAQEQNLPFSEILPPIQSLFLPGNASSAAFLQALKDNDETAVVIESEADVLSGAIKQDWGDYSHLLRQSFHHEPAGKLRQGHRMTIESPALSVAISGTQDQAVKLIQSTENGLFSRFMFYVFSADPVWRDVSPNPLRRSFDEIFEPLAEQTKAMALAINKEGPIAFHLQPAQWEMFNATCSNWLDQATIDVSEQISSTVFRLGLIVFRISMVLSTVRAYEDANLTNSVTCSDTDFQIAIQLGKLLLAHAQIVYNLLPGQPGKTTNKQSQFYEKMPNLFVRQEADQLGTEMKVKKRSVTNYLNNLLNSGQLERLQHGSYAKR